ncbi:hypothetical protein Bca101_004218 [Brassica carinata]
MLGYIESIKGKKNGCDTVSSRLRSFSANEDLSLVQPHLFLLMKGEVSSAASVLESHTGVKSLSPSMALTVAGSTPPPLPPSEPPDPDVGVAFPVDPPDLPVPPDPGPHRLSSSMTPCFTPVPHVLYGYFEHHYLQI